jgi:SAM-dependent methyltransferase
VALLPQLGTPQQFEKVRRLLRNLNFTEESVCARTGITSIFDFKSLGQGRATGSALDDGLDVLIRLLLDSEQVPETRIQYLLPPETLAELEALRLIVQMGGHGDYFGTVRLCPVEGLFVASDRGPPLDPEMLMDGREFVFDPISWNTSAFLKSMPREECDRILDLCCGSGIEALVCAGSARRILACDLASRSVHFTDFNCRLNNISNVGCLQSDLYEAVRDQTFDRILAHPPYVPAGGDEELFYRDGGDDGEQVLRGIVVGLPRYLRPGGLFYAFVMSTDRESGTLPDRVRQWLGEQESEFEIALAPTGEADMKPYERIREELKITKAYFANLSITRK